MPSALIAGVSGIVGNNLAAHLTSLGWQVAGLARNPAVDITNVQPIAADLLDTVSLASALVNIKPTHVFIRRGYASSPKRKTIEVVTDMSKSASWASLTTSRPTKPSSSSSLYYDRSASSRSMASAWISSKS